MKTTQNKKRRILNKLGMTYIELLTALALLSLIIVAFTPMLLQSYEWIYESGQISAEAYNSQKGIEEGLARRDSEESSKISMNLNLGVSSEALFENIHVTGKKVISDVQQNFESLFGRGRGSLEIVSGSTVRDDATSHEIVIQTHGLEYNTVKTGSRVVFDNNGETTQIKEKEIYIEVVMPNKSAGSTGSTGIDAYDGGTVTTEDAVYNNGTLCTVKILDYNTGDPEEGVVSGANVSVSNTNKTNEGRIRLKIQSSDSSKPLDFTYSPVQVKVYYRNARGKIITVQDYLYIEAPTIIFAGDAISGADYFTSAGVQHKQVSASNIANTTHTYTLTTEARAMRVDNSAYLSQTDNHTEASTAVGTPSSRGVTIRSIKWIDNDETAGIKPYYVMVGSESSIYRMYNFTSANTSIYKQSVGVQNVHIDGSEIKNHTSYFGTVGSSRVVDKLYTLSTGQRAYPSLWSGDYSDIFEYGTGDKRTAYGKSVNHSDGDSTWITSKNSGDTYLGLETDKTYFNTFSPVVQYCYFYNGYGNNYTWKQKNYRTISYVLTERGHALRHLGTISDDDNFNDMFAMWDESTFEYASVLKGKLGDFLETSNRMEYWTYKSDEDEGKFGDPAAIYAFRYSAGNNDNTQFEVENTMAQIRLKSLASFPMVDGINHSNDSTGYSGKSNYFDSGGFSGWDIADQVAKLPAVLRGHSGDKTDADWTFGAGDDVEINDVAYIPTAGDTQGSTFYVGTMHAFASLSQTNKINDTHIHNRNESRTHSGIWEGYGYSIYRRKTLNYNQTCYPAGTTSQYLIISDMDGRNTYVVRSDDNSTSNHWNAGDIGSVALYYCYTLGDYGTTLSSDAGAPGDNSTTDVESTDKVAFYIPEIGSSVWRWTKYDDVYFTLGYTSERGRVYKNITYDGTTEYLRGYERHYWRSHYGQDGYSGQGDNVQLSLHIPNRGLCNVNYSDIKSGDYSNSGNLVSKTGTSSSGVAGVGTYVNSYNNDYYNVWFPGEMYNLTKIASKDGITVAVGYAVAGSSYQYASTTQAGFNPDGNDPYMHTSTALGGIYNDGVLSAMINGQNDSFVNLLYFKDNESFDGTSLTDRGLAQYSAYLNKGYDYNGYGLHTRNSVQFTAVDIMVCSPEATSASQSIPVKYYAVYGDNLGRAYYSLVATGSGTATDTDVGDTGITASGASLVPYIKDTTYAGAANSSAGEMTEITVDGAALDTIFKNIGTIDVSGELIIITGEAQDGKPEYFVVGVISSNSDGSPKITWKKVQNGSFKAAITDAVIVGDYYYFIGNDTPQNTTTVKGFLAAVSLEGLRAATNGQVLTPSASPGESEFTGNAITNASKFAVHWNWISADTKVYAIAGRETT